MGNVPVLIAISWTGLIYMALICSMMILDSSIAGRINYQHILLCSALVTALDLVLVPSQLMKGDGSGMNGNHWYSWKNFIGWFFNLLSFYNFHII